MDPRADLREATERNAREAREEREAAEKAAAQAAREQADAAAKAQAEAATAETEAEGSRNQPPLLAIPLRAVAPDTPLPLAEEIVQDPPLMERGRTPWPLRGKRRQQRQPERAKAANRQRRQRSRPGVSQRTEPASRWSQ